MARFISNRNKAKGQAPGSLIFIGDRKMEAPIIHLIQYDQENLLEKEINNIKEVKDISNKDSVTWINIYGIHDLELIKEVREQFGLPSLLIENILNTDARPRFEDADNYDAFILKMLHQNKDNEVVAEQISIILGEHFVLTLQERKGDVFDHVRERIRNKKGKVRFLGNDYLAYILMDTIVDNYTILIENIGMGVEDLEDRIFHTKEDHIAEEIYNFKTELNYVRKAIRPLKDMMTHILRSDNSYFKESNLKYLRNLNELVVHSTDTIELYNNLVSDQLNIYNTNVSNRMNEVMKVLTIFASIFIPLTFIAGVYGMNFEYIPELKYKIAYPIFWGVVISTIIGLLIYFKRKRWL